MEIKQIDIKLLENNTGQIEGLPKNPRFIRDKRYESLKQSIIEDPEMLELRELIVYPFGKKYVTIGGNMRLRVGKDLGYTTMPCKILEKDTPIEKLRAYTIKDNVSFGDNDHDLIANEWDISELEAWGFELPEIDLEGEEETEENEPKNYNITIICQDEAEQINKKNELLKLGFTIK